MSTAIELLQECENAQIKLAVGGPNRLNYSCPKGALTPDLKKQILQLKPELIVHLSKPKLVANNPSVQPKRPKTHFHIFSVEVDGRPLILLSLHAEIEDVRELLFKKFGVERVGKIVLNGQQRGLIQETK